MGEGKTPEVFNPQTLRADLRPSVVEEFEDPQPDIGLTPVSSTFYDAPIEEHIMEEDEEDFADEWTKKHLGSTNGHRLFYPAALGLSSNGSVVHLFTRPVELLANCVQYSFRNGILTGCGQIKRVRVSPKGSFPELSNVQFLAIQAEEMLSSFSRLPPCPDKRRYFRNLRILKFMRTTFDALLLAYQEIKLRTSHRTRDLMQNLSSRRCKAINRFKGRLVVEPARAARELKSLAGACRQWYYGKPWSQCLRGHPLGNLQPDEKWQANTFSYLARSLPPPPVDLNELNKLADRLCSDPVPENPDWRPWLKTYFTERFPLKRPLDLWTMPSSHASLGYAQIEVAMHELCRTLSSSDSR